MWKVYLSGQNKEDDANDDSMLKASKRSNQAQDSNNNCPSSELNTATALTQSHSQEYLIGCKRLFFQLNYLYLV